MTVSRFNGSTASFFIEVAFVIFLKVAAFLGGIVIFG